MEFYVIFVNFFYFLLCFTLYWWQCNFFCLHQISIDTVPGVIGTLQALEAIKIASGVGEPLTGRMLIFDALSGRIRVV